MASSSKRMVTLRSSDGMTREVEESAAARSSIIKNLINVCGADKIIPIPNVSSVIIYKALEYLTRLHFQCTAVCWQGSVEKIKAWEAWDDRFVQVYRSTLPDIYKAAEILEIDGLQNLISRTLKKDMATGIAEQQVLKRTRTQKYYTKEEEEERRKRYRIPNDTTGFVKHRFSLSSTMSNSSMRMVTIKSSDGETFEVEESVAVQARTIKKMIEAHGAVKTIDIDNVSGKILSKALEFCRRKHLEFAQFDNRTLCELSSAAGILEIDGLQDLIFQTLKDINTGKVVQETRNKTRIKKYYTRQEEEEWRKIALFPNDPPKEIVLNLGNKSTEDEVSEFWKQYSILNDPTKEIPNEPLKGKESPKYTEEEETELWKQCSIRHGHEPPKERDFLKNLGKESPKYTEEEETELWKQCSTRHGHEPPKEIDFLKNLGKESTRREAEAAEEFDFSKNFRK